MLVNTHCIPFRQLESFMLGHFLYFKKTLSRHHTTATARTVVYQRDWSRSLTHAMTFLARLGALGLQSLPARKTVPASGPWSVTVPSRAP